MYLSGVSLISVAVYQSQIDDRVWPATNQHPYRARGHPWQNCPFIAVSRVSFFVAHWFTRQDAFRR